MWPDPILSRFYCLGTFAIGSFFLSACVSSSRTSSPLLLSEEQLTQDIQKTCQASHISDHLEKQFFESWVFQAQAGKYLSPYLKDKSNPCSQVLESHLRELAQRLRQGNPLETQEELWKPQFLLVKIGLDHDTPGALEAAMSFAEFGSDPNWTEILCASAPGECRIVLEKKMVRQVEKHQKKGVSFAQDSKWYGMRQGMESPFQDRLPATPHTFLKLVQLYTLPSVPGTPVKVTEPALRSLFAFYGGLDPSHRELFNQGLVDTCRLHMSECLKAARGLVPSLLMPIMEVLATQKSPQVVAEITWIATHHQEPLLAQRAQKILESF